MTTQIGYEMAGGKHTDAQNIGIKSHVR